MVATLGTLFGTAAATTAGAAATGAVPAAMAATNIASTLGAAGAASSAFSTANIIGSALAGASALSSVAQAYQQKGADRISAKQAEVNATQAETEAMQRANLIRQKALQATSSATAAYASRGIMPNIGTPAQVNAESLNQANRDASVELNAGKMTALGYRAKAADLKESNRYSLLSGIVQGAGTLAGSGSVQRILGK